VTYAAKVGRLAEPGSANNEEDRMAGRLRWQVAGLAAVVVILACVLVIPQWLVGWELGAATRTLTAADRAKAINDVRGTLLQGIGGAAILLGAYFTYRQLHTGREQLQTAQQGQVTERFTRAIDQLGHAEVDVRLGGIYALERIANDSPDDRATIAEVLTAFVRGHAPWPPTLSGQYVASAQIDQVPELQVRAPDVQAALTVLVRRQPSPQPSQRLDLHATDLRKALLDGAQLQGVNLADATLQGVRLDGVNLRDADLAGTNFQGASMHRAQLQRARLHGAQLQRVYLAGANFQRADLGSAQLQQAVLWGANLQDAHLAGVQLQHALLLYAQLQGANLSGAQLQEAHLPGAQLQAAILLGAQLQAAILHGAQLQGASLDDANLQDADLDNAKFENAYANEKTVWPAGFDPRHAGVVLDRIPVPRFDDGVLRIDRLANTADEPES
jgi:uncharacterized protein YjbI with pentapeptide repeats